MSSEVLLVCGFALFLAPEFTFEIDLTESYSHLSRTQVRNSDRSWHYFPRDEHSRALHFGGSSNARIDFAQTKGGIPP